jgi:chorismate synthase
MATGLPAGLGDPIFGGMESRISAILFGIPAVKGVEFGAGFGVAAMTGSQNNDPFFWRGNQIETETNHAGGILGGITTGMPLVVRTAFKPTPSISREQTSISLSQKKTARISVPGRHDPCIVPRAVPVVEAAVSFAVLDAWLGRKKRGIFGFGLDFFHSYAIINIPPPVFFS